MKAAVWTEIGTIEVREIPVPEPQAGEVLLRVTAAGLCITDLHVYTGQFAYGHPPQVLGHEIAGVVCVAGSPELEELVGKRVTVETSVGCGKCVYCKTGRRHLCPQMTEIGFTPHSGGYAQYVKVPAENLVELPNGVSDEEAGILESVVCPLGALMRNGVRFGETVVVFGAGPAGLAFMQGAKMLGAGKVIAVARNARRLERARQFGADCLINAADDVEQAVLRETGGLGAGLVCEAAGTPATIGLAIHTAQKAGRVILYGIPGDEDAFNFPATHIITNQLEIHGAVGEPAVWGPLLELIAAGRFHIQDMITHRIALDDIVEGFEMLKTKKGDPIKIVVRP